MKPRVLFTVVWFAVASSQDTCPGRPPKPCGCAGSNLDASPTSRGSKIIRDQATSEYYYIDDMVFRKGQFASDGPAETLNMDLWPGGLIFYFIDDSFSSNFRKNIVAAFTAIQTAVGEKHLEFKEARNTRIGICPKNYIHIEKIKARKCEAMVGMQQNGASTLFLNEIVCTPGIIQHELLHSLGRYHEQCRPDRDKYVELFPEEISASDCHNFRKMPENALDPSLTLPYDPDSIMHYGSCHFSCRGHTTMLRKTGGKRFVVANRKMLTELDVQKLRLMYPADSKRTVDKKHCSDANQSTNAHPIRDIGVVFLSAVLAIVVRLTP